MLCMVRQEQTTPCMAEHTQKKLAKKCLNFIQAKHSLKNTGKNYQMLIREWCLPTNAAEKYQKV